MQLDKEDTQLVKLNSKYLTVVLKYLDSLQDTRCTHPAVQVFRGRGMYVQRRGDIVMQILRHVNETASFSSPLDSVAD